MGAGTLFGILIALIIWAVQLVWLYRRAAESGDDPFDVVSGAAIFFVLAAPIAIWMPELVETMASFWKRLVSGELFKRGEEGSPRLDIAGKNVLLTQDHTRIGRYPNNDIVLDHPTVSAYHAEIALRPDGRHELMDRESRNGTRINGTPIRSAVLRDGDQITLGAITLHYLVRVSADRAMQGGGIPASRR